MGSVPVLRRLKLLGLGFHRRTDKVEAELMARIAQSITASLELDTVLQQVVEGARELCRCDLSHIALRESGTEASVIRCGAGAGDQGHRGFRIEPGEGVGGRVLLTGCPVRTDNCADDPHLGTDGLSREVGAVAAMAVPIRIHERVEGLLLVANRSPRPFTDRDEESLRRLAAHAATAIQNAQLFEQVRAGRGRLETLSRRLLEIQEAERRHIARELHDEIGQALTGLKLSLEMSTGARGSAAAPSLDEARRLVNDLIARVRELSLDLRPAMLDDLGLLAALVWHFERYAKQTGVRVEFQHAGLDRRFRPDVETAAYRIAQEALTNVARHAGVRAVAVRVRAEGNALTVEVEDRGRGFDGAAALRPSGGLGGMRERAVLLGGRLTVDSALGAGTCVTAELPLGQPLERRRATR